MKRNILLLSLLTACTFLIAQPNFVLIISDDMGWNGSSVQISATESGSSSDFYLTPKLEEMAQAGMIFSQGYAPAPKCSPTRCSLQTGKSTASTQFTATGSGLTTGKLLVSPATESQINSADLTFPEWLKSTGLNYRTAHFGKWHLGGNGPSAHGFDFSDGNTTNGDGDNGGGTAQTDPKKIFTLTNQSISFIQDANTDGVPFFLQLSHYAVHTTVEAQQATIDLYNDANARPVGTVHNNVEYGAMTEDMDTGIGILLEEITKLGLDSNTYIVFMSDNGAQTNQSSNEPLRWGKNFLFEGGIRVPFIVKGPGIAANSRSDEAVVGYDLFPTFAALTGANTALPNDLDGVDISPVFLNGSTLDRQKAIYFHSPHYENNRNKTPRSAMVEGNYKLIVEYETGNTFLYDLESDLEEANDLSDSLPQRTLAMCVELRDYLLSVNARMPALDGSHISFEGSGTDVDNDGLEDAWEFTQLLSYTYGPSDDPDGDGISNLDEYNAGSDPYQMTTSIHPELANKITVYPNPAKDWVKVILSGDLKEPLSMKLHDLQGRVVARYEDFTETILVDQLPTGKYFLQIDFKEGYVVKPILIE